MIENIINLGWAWMVILLRLGAAMMIMPGIGEVSVPPNIRLSVAITTATALAPVLGETAVIPSDLNALFLLVISETIIGLLIGGIGRFLMAALDVAGTIIAFQTGLSFATQINPGLGQLSASLSSFIGVTGLVLFISADLHLGLLSAAAGSFATMPAGAPLDLGDAAMMATQGLATAFTLGFQMSGPFIVFGVAYALIISVLNKLAPQIQLYFAAQSGTTLFGFVVLSATLSAGLLLWLAGAETAISQL